MEHDKDFVLRLLDIREDQLINVSRAGPPIGSLRNDRRTTRPLIITVSTPEMAAYLHNYGRGWRIASRNGVFWVNPDLIKADRIANAKARDARKMRRQRGMIVTDEVAGSPRRHTPNQQNSPPRRRAPAHHNSPLVHTNRMPIVNGLRDISPVGSANLEDSRGSQRSGSHRSHRSRRSRSRHSFTSQRSGSFRDGGNSDFE